MLRGPRELLKGCKLPGPGRRIILAQASRDKPRQIDLVGRAQPMPPSGHVPPNAVACRKCSGAVVQNAVKRGPESSYPQCQLELAAALADLTRKRIAVRKNDDVCHRARPSELL